MPFYSRSPHLYTFLTNSERTRKIGMHKFIFIRITKGNFNGFPWRDISRIINDNGYDKEINDINGNGNNSNTTHSHRLQNENKKKKQKQTKWGNILIHFGVDIVVIVGASIYFTRIVGANAQVMRERESEGVRVRNGPVTKKKNPYKIKKQKKYTNKTHATVYRNGLFIILNHYHT